MCVMPSYRGHGTEQQHNCFLPHLSLPPGGDEGSDPIPEDPQELATGARYLWVKSTKAIRTQVIPYTINGHRAGSHSL